MNFPNNKKIEKTIFFSLKVNPNFLNNKKTFLSKLDKSKKGDLDEKIISLIEAINQKQNYYTTSSCSGRVYLWCGSGKKNETQWLKVSHDLTKEDFYQTKESGLIWLRLEDFILHVCCDNLESANRFLNLARKLYKKSSILTISSKIIVEVRGSEFLEMPLYLDGQELFSGDFKWLTNLINIKMKRIWKKELEFEKSIRI